MAQLWVQEKVQTCEIELQKIGTLEHLADAMTKYLAADQIKKHMCFTNQEMRAGRHEIMPSAAI